MTHLLRSIAAKFLLPVGALVVLLCGVVVYRHYAAYERHIRTLMDQQAGLALEFDLAIREYVGEEIRPAMEERVGPGEFIPETMSTSFVARRIFEKVGRRFPGYILKFSSDNPRNPLNRATPGEQRMLAYFRAHPEVEQWAGAIELEGIQYFAQFRPRRMSAACLHCHGQPEDAPASLVARYGPTAGFHQQAGDVTALDTVAIPLAQAEATLAAQTIEESTVLVGGLVLLFGVIAWMFRRTVVRRLAEMAAHFERIAAHPESAQIAPLAVRGRDEIAALAGSFNVLADRLRQAQRGLEQRVEKRTRELAQANEELHREIGARAHSAETLRQSNQQLENLNERLHATGHELKVLMQGVVEDATRKTRFQNQSLQCCWEVKGCAHKSCPAHGRRDDLRCWETAGTFCRGQVQGQFAQKLKDCRRCEVYIQARQDSICDLGETFNDMIAILEGRQEELAVALCEAEAATVAKSAFLANMSHEIRTPMTAILGYAGIIQQQITCCTRCPDHAGCQQREKCTDMIQTIQRNGDHLLHIVDDILDLSKIEAGKMTVERIVCAPCELVAQVASMARVPVEAKGLRFEVEYEGAIPATIQTDPTRLRQILINLIGNATKFTAAGSVRLITRLVDDPGSPASLQFDVQDTGIGLTAEQVGRLFLAFSQADTSMTRKFGGTGLGLTISKRLAKLLGGDVVVVDSKPGVGTRFRVTVATGALDGVSLLSDPLAATVDRNSTHKERPELDKPMALRGRILLAEDGPDNRRLIVHFLKSAGAEVAVAENGQLAVDVALRARDEGRPFDVILMDMQMPVMDGYAAARLLRAEGYTGPIIALTAHAMSEDREKCLQAGCDDYASKPIDRRRLIATIQNQLRVPQAAAAKT